MPAQGRLVPVRRGRPEAVIVADDAMLSSRPPAAKARRQNHGGVRACYPERVRHDRAAVHEVKGHLAPTHGPHRGAVSNVPGRAQCADGVAVEQIPRKNVSPEIEYLFTLFNHLY